jgi:hypothetical protein
MSRVELFESICRDARHQGMGIGALARTYRVHRRTVRQALMRAVPPEWKRRNERRRCLGRGETLICTWVTADQVLPKKQRHTARLVLAAAGRRLRRRAGLGRPLAATSVGLRRELTGGVGCVTVPQVLQESRDGSLVSLSMTCPQTSVSATATSPPPPRLLEVSRTRVRNQRRAISASIAPGCIGHRVGRGEDACHGGEQREPTRADG